ncbi:MAG: 16S rRNA processing protein RimM, partial [Clostridia bacterium]|nr:16S rRNA processing protein RimM [Clostridia bacterium]
MLDSYLVIGEILKPQGVRGEVKARAITNDVTRFADIKYAFLEKNGEFNRVSVRCVRIDPDAVYLKIEGIDDRDAAEAL